ncbi:NupC/NupG family nucleoside CNT transporter [Candidatus Paracaedibacter symbiosus]|uniref:NupC/NupG family nucleoside CNT transporter n=1 Tax=Candidatus Paracaedibacter symbiosus TaxID=244582 RepID=UPI0005097DC3|nr:nucleoside transporter C-terminal domain-containing protein [Candidatus Paracaedibacter symbiosus]
MQAFLGIFLLLGFCWFFSENKQQINYAAVFKALALQLVLAVLIFKVPAVSYLILKMASVIDILKQSTLEGTKFVFGYLGGGETPFHANPESAASPFIFALQALPVVIVVSALSMLLFHWRILPLIVKGISFVLRRVLNIGGALGTMAAAKIFLGNVETPLLVRPYLKNFSRSEIFTMMTCGMATAAMSLMPVYSDILAGVVEFPMQHLIAATLLNIPAAIALSQIIIPNTEPVTEAEVTVPYNFSGPMDAISRGTTDGLSIFLNVIAMLIVALAFVSLTNTILGYITLGEGSPLSLEKIFGFVLAPFAWLMGASWSESQIVAQLLGVKTVLNEIIAFSQLKTYAASLSPTTVLMMVYALCGFANFSAIGIVLGGLSAMVPEHRQTVISLSFKSLIVGALSSCLSAMIVGLLLKVVG